MAMMMMVMMMDGDDDDGGDVCRFLAGAAVSSSASGLFCVKCLFFVNSFLRFGVFRGCLVVC